ncbi:hypothetical protein EJ08DRAFT_665687 [Tothia fuscella]|uniref:Uncharacterized protein n=1 Tax=Tothia fuscella TaxID=1048955 RepID=A0A9P4TTE0_9PEZI|nr:hypothetical protein EJ08DRAFT_665687 [Tothia fuscella]
MSGLWQTALYRGISLYEFGKSTFAAPGHRLCAGCKLRKIRMVYVSDFEDEEIGTIQDVSERQHCTICRMVYNILLDRNRTFRENEIDQSVRERLLLRAGSAQVVLAESAEREIDILLRRSERSRAPSLPLRFEKFCWSNAEGEGQLGPRVWPLDLEAIRRIRRMEIVQASGGSTLAMRRIHSMINTCVSTHGERCNGGHIAGMRDDRHFELIFIHVVDACLMRGTSQSGYLARKSAHAYTCCSRFANLVWVQQRT